MQSYPYAVGRIRVLENKLLNAAKMEQMLSAKNEEEIYRILSDAGYTVDKDTDAMLSDELKKVYTFLKSLTPESKIFDLFLLKNDYHNLKVILKSTLAGVDGKDAFYSYGNVSVEKLKALYHDKKLSDISLYMEKAASEATDVYTKTGDFRAADLCVEKIAYREMLDKAQRTKESFVLSLVQSMIDIANICTLIRIRRAEQPETLLQAAFLEGGKLTETFLQDVLHEKKDFSKTEYASLSEAAENGFTALERAADDYIIAYAKKAKLEFVTVSPLVAYLLAKETEIKNVRIILIGRENHVEKEIIRERLRKLYV